MSDLHKKLHCGHCGKIFYGRKEGDKVPRHHAVDANGAPSGKWCSGAGHFLELHVVPPAEPESCLVCQSAIAIGEKAHMVKGPARVMDFGSGHVTYVVDAGTPVVGGIHLACLRKAST